MCSRKKPSLAQWRRPSYMVTKTGTVNFSETGSVLPVLGCHEPALLIADWQNGIDVQRRRLRRVRDLNCREWRHEEFRLGIVQRLQLKSLVALAIPHRHYVTSTRPDECRVRFEIPLPHVALSWQNL